MQFDHEKRDVSSFALIHERLAPTNAARQLTLCLPRKELGDHRVIHSLTPTDLSDPFREHEFQFAARNFFVEPHGREEMLSLRGVEFMHPYFVLVFCLRYLRELLLKLIV